jgi:hypothetical protein
MDGRLLVAHQDVLKLVLLENLVVNVQNRTAGIAENMLNAFFFKATHDDLRAVQDFVFGVGAGFRARFRAGLCCAPLGAG